MKRIKAERIKKVIEQYKQITGRTATLYQKDERICFDGFKVMTVPEGLTKMYIEIEGE